MIYGLGTDITEVKRIAKSVKKEAFKKKMFSKQEILYCEAKANSGESFAARFAAKEAFFKALGTGWRGGVAFNEVEILNDKLGKPEIHLKGETKKILKKLKFSAIHVSLSHTKDIAVATVVIEK